jgi:hypothetical protein
MRLVAAGQAQPLPPTAKTIFTSVVLFTSLGGAQGWRVSVDFGASHEMSLVSGRKRPRCKSREAELPPLGLREGESREWFASRRGGFPHLVARQAGTRALVELWLPAVLAELVLDHLRWRFSATAPSEGRCTSASAGRPWAVRTLDPCTGEPAGGIFELHILVGRHSGLDLQIGWLAVSHPDDGRTGSHGLHSPQAVCLAIEQEKGRGCIGNAFTSCWAGSLRFPFLFEGLRPEDVVSVRYSGTTGEVSFRIERDGMPVLTVAEAVKPSSEQLHRHLPPPAKTPHLDTWGWAVAGTFPVGLSSRPAVAVRPRPHGEAEVAILQ